MNLIENIHRIKEMMGIDNTRHTFDIQKLVDDNIIFVTKPGDGQGGIDEPNWDGDCSVITLDNLTKQEVKLNPWRLKAIKHPLPNCIPFVQDGQSEWSDEKYHQVISSIKRAGGDIKDYIMNLQENIHRIHTLINEDKREHTIRTMIEKMGITNAIKMAGNYYAIEPYLKVIDKINFIKEKVNELSEWIGGGFGLVEIDEEPIHYGEDENEVRQIEYLGKNGVTVDVYDTDMNSHMGEFNVKYENLPVQIIEELVEILLNH